MADKAVINLSTGLEDTERVTVAFLVAGGALEQGRQVAMFLTKEAVRLALPGVADAVAFRRRFDLMALQRNLKALGTFGYQTMTRRNPVYIQYMPRTLRYARTNLAKYPRFDRLRELLAAHVEELQ